MKVNFGDPQGNTVRRELRRSNLYRGIYARVARKIGVDRSLVSRVARGEKRSKRVEQALLREIGRIERLAGRAVA